MGKRPSQQLTGALKMVRRRFDIDVEKLLASMGDQWVSYSHPALRGIAG